MFGELRQDIAMCEVKNEPRGDKFGERHLDNTIMRWLAAEPTAGPYHGRSMLREDSMCGSWHNSFLPQSNKNKRSAESSTVYLKMRSVMWSRRHSRVYPTAQRLPNRQQLVTWRAQASFASDQICQWDKSHGSPAILSPVALNYVSNFLCTCQIFFLSPVALNYVSNILRVHILFSICLHQLRAFSVFSWQHYDLLTTLRAYFQVLLVYVAGVYFLSFFSTTQRFELWRSKSNGLAGRPVNHSGTLS